jgi:predicted component of type VI protein secretion system
MTMFYYRAHALNRQSMSYDRVDDDVFSGIIKSFAGLPPESKVDKKQEAITLSYAHNLASGVKNRDNLEAMLKGLLGLPLELRDFILSSHDIPVDSYAVLGKRATSTLGLNIQIGRKFLSVTLKYEVRIGPISFDDYEKLVSGFTGLNIIARAVHRYLDRPLEYDLVFSLYADTLPDMRLGFDWQDEKGDAAQLGYTCWLGGRRNAGETVLLVIDGSRLNKARHKKSFRNDRD